MRQHHLSRTFHHEFTASLAMVEPDSWQYALDWKLSALRSRPEPTRAASPSSRWPIRAPARSGSTGPTTPPSPRLLCPGPRVKRTRCSRSVSEEYKLHLRRVKEHQVTFNNAKLVRSFTHTLLLQAQAVRRGRAAAGHLMEEFQAQRYSGSLLPFFCYYTALSSFSGMIVHLPEAEARMFIWTVLIKCSLIQIVIEEINRETSLEYCVFIKMSFDLEISSLLILY